MSGWSLVVLIGLGVGLLWFGWMAWRDRGYFEVAGLGLSVGAYSALGLLLFGGMGFALAFVLPFVGLLFPALGLAVLVMAARASWIGRRDRAFLVLGYLDQATRFGMPLPGVLRAAARGERGRTGRRLWRLAEGLERGGGLSEGLGRLVPEVSASDRGALAAAERSGRLGEALAAAHGRHLDRLRGETGDGLGDETVGGPWLGAAYGVVVTACVLAMAAGITLLIFPKYIEIFDDFGVRLPWSTRVTFSVLGHALLPGQLAAWSGDWSRGWLGWALLGLPVLAVGVTSGVCLRMVVRGGVRGVRGSAVLRGWWGGLPVVGSATRRRSWARAYEAAGGSLSAGRGLPEALADGSVAAVDRSVERRLGSMLSALVGGAALPAAARAAGLGRMDRGVLSGLAGGGGGGDLADAFGFLGAYHADAAERRRLALRTTVLPVVMLVLALVVGWLCYAVFSPLVVLIDSVAPMWGLG